MIVVFTRVIVIHKKINTHKATENIFTPYAIPM